MQGVQTDTRVLIVVLTDIEHVVACLALMHIGAVPVSVKPPKGLSDAYREYLTRIADTFGITYGYHTLPLPTSVRPLRSSAEAPYKAARASLPHQPNPDDVVFIQFSSGSVSAPKAIPITRRALAANISAILRWDGRHSDSGLFCQMPLSHDMGFVGGLLSSLCSQNPLILTPVRRFFSKPVACLSVAQTLRTEITLLPNFAMDYVDRALRRLPPHGAPLLFAHYRSIYCGSEPIRQASVSSFLATAVPRGLNPEAMTFCYGLAEATLMVTAHRFRGLARSFNRCLTNSPVACVGKPVAGWKCGSGRGRTRSGRSRSAAIPYLPGTWFRRPAHSWFDTQDFGYFVRGELHVCGRAQDRIFVNGEKLFAADVEAAIQRAVQVRGCVVLPHADEIMVAPVAVAERCLPSCNRVAHFRVRNQADISARRDTCRNREVFVRQTHARSHIHGATTASCLSRNRLCKGHGALKRREIRRQFTSTSTMDVFYFGAGERRLLGCYHEAERVDGVAVLCQPFAHEYTRAYACFRHLAARLARAGLSAFRFDYGCTGDSAGNYEHATIEEWLRDVAAAITEARSRRRTARVALIGLRLGATLAEYSGARSP